MCEVEAFNVVIKVVRLAGDVLGCVRLCVLSRIASGVNRKR